VLPVFFMLASLVALTIACCDFLHQAAGGITELRATPAIVIATIGFLVSSVVTVVLQAIHLSARVVGPERRLRETLARVRSGDLSQRVVLRRGDLLQDLADDVNTTIEWLNRNPPAGAVTGGDVLDVDHHEDIEIGEPAWDACAGGEVDDAC